MKGSKYGRRYSLFKKIIECFKVGIKIEFGNKDIEKLENLIKAYKELEDTHNKLLKRNEWYKEYYECFSIPKTKIQEKIEEYKKLLMSCNRFSDVDRIKAINERILAYEELLNT